MTRYLPSMAALLLLVFSTAAVDASVLIDVGELHLRPGETGFVDVTIRSDDSDLLDSFGLELQITTTSGTSQLEFVTGPEMGFGIYEATDPHLGNSEYLFHGDSLVKSGGWSPAGQISTTSATNDTYIGGDGTMSGDGVSVPTTDALLTRLEVTAATSAPPAVGDTFTISVPESSPYTYFYDPDLSSLSSDTRPGAVTMVPEASALLTWLFLGGLGLGTFRLRGRYR